METTLGTSIVTNILTGNHVEVWSVTISYFAYLLGLILVISGLVMFTKANNKGGMGRTTHGSAIATMCSGFALLSLKGLIVAGTYTMFASNSAGDYQFVDGALSIQDRFSGNVDGPMAIYVELISYIMMIVGLIAVIKALFLFREATQNSKSAVSGIWFFVGGISALNFKGAMNLLGETAGPDVQSILSQVFG